MQNLPTPENIAPAKAEEKEMSFLDHLEELRWHLIRSAAAILIIAIAVFLCEKQVTAILFGPKHEYFLTYRIFCKYFNTFCTVPQFDIIQRDLGEEFFVHLKSSVWIGLMIAFPYVFYEMWRFVKPGLYPNERKAARGIVAVCSLLFFTGVLFGYFIIAPFAISFLANYRFGEDVISTTTLSSYVSYLTMITLPTGIIFELPIVAFFLGKIGILTASIMKRYRKHAAVIIFIAAAIITPPDVITQFLIAIPLLILYEISIYIVKRQEKKEAEEE